MLTKQQWCVILMFPLSAVICATIMKVVDDTNLLIGIYVQFVTACLLWIAFMDASAAFRFSVHVLHYWGIILAIYLVKTPVAWDPYAAFATMAILADVILLLVFPRSNVRPATNQPEK
jgi:hypothetical protein